jgi:hypothetical protein
MPRPTKPKKASTEAPKPLVIEATYKVGTETFTSMDEAQAYLDTHQRLQAVAAKQSAFTSKVGNSARHEKREATRDALTHLFTRLAKDKDTALELYDIIAALHPDQFAADEPGDEAVYPAATPAEELTRFDTFGGAAPVFTSLPPAPPALDLNNLPPPPPPPPAA